MKVLIIGMNNPLSMDPKYALYPHPPGCAGWNLWKKMEDAVPEFDQVDYKTTFDRVNLVRGEWNDGLAVSKAAQMLKEDALHDRHVLLLGERVQRSFRVAGCDVREFGQFKFFLPPIPKAKRMWAHVPHPSGRSRVWNDPAVRDEARIFFKQLVSLAQKAA